MGKWTIGESDRLITDISQLITRRLAEGASVDDVVRELVHNGCPKNWSVAAVRAGTETVEAWKQDHKGSSAGASRMAPDELVLRLHHRLETLSETLVNARALLAGGAKREQVADQLAKQGLEGDSAVGLADDAQIELEVAIKEYENSPEGRQEIADANRRRVVSGILWVCGGLAATFGTMAISPGGYFLVFWGAVLFGLYDMVRGLIGCIWYSRPLANDAASHAVARPSGNHPIIREASLVSARPTYDHGKSVPESRETVTKLATREPFAACLLFRSGPRTGESVALTDTATCIGRASDNDLIVGDSKASRHHARILLHDGSYVAEDLGSSNGTFVDGTKIYRTPLQPGSTLQIGDTKLIFDKARTH